MSNGIIMTDAMETAIREMIEKARNNVDMDRLRDMIAELYGFEAIDNMDFFAGEFTVENNQPAIRMDYKVTVTVPVHFDLKGNVIFSEEYEEEYEAPDSTGAMEEMVEDAGMQAGEQTQNF